MLARLLRRAGEERSTPFIVNGPGGLWGYTGSAVATEALTSDAVWACVDVLASSISGLPIDVVRQVDNRRLPVSPTPSLIAQPSALVPLDVWTYQLAWSMLTDGNAFGKVMAVDAFARPTLIELCDPADVTERRVVKGVAQAKIAGEVEQLYPHGDLWHVAGKMVVPGTPFALSPVQYANKAITAGLSAEDFGLRFFTDGGHPAGIIYSDEELTQDQATAVKMRFKAATQGNREPAVFGAGLKYERVSVDPKDSQFLDLQRLTTEKVCRFFRVPPAMVYASVSGQNVTYANVSQADLHYLKHSLDGYLVRLENALTKLLPPPQVVRFNRNALLRSDAEGRNNVYDKRLRNKTMSINEVRALEDEPPFGEEFDVPGIPAEDDAERRLSAVEAVQKAYLGVDKVITCELINEAGGNLAIPGPDFTAPQQEGTP